MATEMTPTAELVALKMDVDLPAWIEERRQKGWSFGRLAAEIYAQSGVYVTAQSIRSWVLAADLAAS